MKLKFCSSKSRRILLSAVSVAALAVVARAEVPYATANPFERSIFGDDWGVLSNDIFFGGARGMFGLSPASRMLVFSATSTSKSTSESNAIVDAAMPGEDLFNFASSLGSPFGIGRGPVSGGGGGVEPLAPTPPDFYWDTNGNLPATGGTGTWDFVSLNWNDSTGLTSPSVIWANGNNAHFTGAPGIVSVNGNGTVTPTSVSVEVTGYTFTTTSFQDAINGPIQISAGMNLFIHELLTNSNKTLEIGGSITGGIGSGITIRGNQFLATHSRILLTAPDSSIDVPITILRGGTGPGPIGVVAGASGQTITGSITNNSDGPTLLGADTGADLTVSGAISGIGGLRVSNTAGSQTGLTGGGGIVVLTGNNTFSGDTVVATDAGGTLVLASTSGGQALGGTANVLINSGTLRLGQSNQINNEAGVTLSGGTIALSGFAEGAPGTNGVGALTLTNNSTIDFAAGPSFSIIQFAGLGTHTAGMDLLITNWNGDPNAGGGPERLLFSGNEMDFRTQYAQGDVFFNGTMGYNIYQFGGYYEVTAVPEPGTWTGAALALIALGYTQRRRLRRKVEIRK